MKKLLLLAVVLGFLVVGCTTDRVWQKSNTTILSGKEEVAAALQKCEQTESVSAAHKVVHGWRTATLCTFLIPYVGLFVNEFGLKSTQRKYVKRLEDCMKESEYQNTPQRSGMKWDYHSPKDYSKAEWLERKKDNQSKPLSNQGSEVSKGQGTSVFKSK